MSGSHEKLPMIFWVQIALVLIVGAIYLMTPAAPKHHGEGAAEVKHEVDATTKTALKPIGEVAVKVKAGESATSRSGEDIVKTKCAACHIAGVANAPKLDASGKDAWAKRMDAEKGLDGLVASAQKGKGGMPPNAGDPSLSAGELKSAIVYMLTQAGVEVAAADSAPVKAKSKATEAPADAPQAETKTEEKPVAKAVDTATATPATPQVEKTEEVSAAKAEAVTEEVKEPASPTEPAVPAAPKAESAELTPPTKTEAAPAAPTAPTVDAAPVAAVEAGKLVTEPVATPKTEEAKPAAEPAPAAPKVEEAKPAAEPTPVPDALKAEEAQPAVEPASATPKVEEAKPAAEPAPAAPKVEEAKPATEPTPVPAAPKVEEAKPAAPAANEAAAIDLKAGEKVYKTVCFTCHDMAVANAPKPGDKAAWAPRIAKGMDALYNTAINGDSKMPTMPAKGGNPTLSDSDVKNAVSHMIELSK